MATFDRFDICAAYFIYATLWNGDDYTNRLHVRLAKLKYRPSRSEEYATGLGENAQLILIDLIERRHGAEEAERMRREVLPEAADATIHLRNSDDDPLTIDATVTYEFAHEWADAVGSCEGGTWEGGKGDMRGMVYDRWTWHPDMVENLRKDGFRLDLSEYSCPDDRDIAISKHSCECSVCDYDYRKAEEHLEKGGAKMSGQAT